MNDHNTAHPDAMPVALLLYSPTKGTNYETDPLGALPREDLVTSYERQWYRFEFEGKNYALRPTHAAHSPFNYLWPDASEPDGELAHRLGAGIIIGAWHPEGVTSTAAQRRVQWNMLLELVEETGLPSLVMTALQSGSQWVEPVVFVTGLSRGAAEEIAQELGQRAVVELDRARVHPLILDGTQSLGYAWSLHALAGAPCALSLGCELTFSPKRVGGPYVSRSREVASLWSSHRKLTHELLGCDPCQNGASVATVSGKNIPGAPIALSEVLPATRYTYSRHVREGDEPPVKLEWPDYS
jgi:hypothetical protein